MPKTQTKEYVYEGEMGMKDLVELFYDGLNGGLA